jgi:hypothetical protein
MKKLLFYLTLTLVSGSISAQQVIRLYEGRAPGSPETKVEEKVTYSPSGEIMGISNVVDPSITIYLPDSKIATGTAVVLCPGGGMRFLGWNNDVIKMAKFLNEKGIAAIGLKYRLWNETPPPATTDKNNQIPMGLTFSINVTEFGKLNLANANPSNNPESTEAVYRSAADAQEAVRIIRKHALEWKINPDRIGFLGFSAGGGVAIAAVIRNKDKETMPNFIATAYGPSLIDVIVPNNAPNLFICTNAEHTNVAAGCLALFLEWKKAAIPAEIHIYGNGKGGFSIDKQGQDSDTWGDSFITWLTTQGF